MQTHTESGARAGKPAPSGQERPPVTATPTTAAPLAASASASASDGRNEELVRAALRDLQDLQSGPDAAAAIFARLAPGFRLRANGVAYDAPGFVAMWLGRKALLEEIRFELKDVYGRADRVAVLRQASVKTKDGAVQPAIHIIDVWRAGPDGKLLSGDQVWQRLQGPAGDDIPLSPREGSLGERVRQALNGLQNLGAVQEHLAEYWDPAYSGCIDGVEMDFAAMCRHWSALQELLSTMIVDVKELVVHGHSVGVNYHILCGRRDRRVVELRMLAVFTVHPESCKILTAQAVSRLIAGRGGDDQELATVMPA